MNKSTLKAEFINAKIKDAKYIGVSIKTEGSRGRVHQDPYC